MSAGDAVTRRDSFEHFEREREAAYRDMPPVNVLVAGPTGVGKSTLVNAILRTPVAKTGKGRPVTEDIQAWSVPGVPITVYDTPGLELDERSGKAAKRVARFVKDQLAKPPAEHLHVFWYCVHAQGNRFQDAEADFIEEISRLLPSIVVLTQVLGPEDADAAEFATDCPRPPRRAPRERHGVLADPTLALARRVDAHEFPPFGLRELVDETYRLLPEAVKRAFSNAQGINLDLKRREGHKVVVQHTTMAAGIGAVPIPIPDTGPLLASGDDARPHHRGDGRGVRRVDPGVPHPRRPGERHDRADRAAGVLDAPEARARGRAGDQRDGRGRDHRGPGRGLRSSAWSTSDGSARAARCRRRRCSRC